jgi:uncharacterized membrane protein YgdD (TMEM256/DUF423 family)
MWNTWLIFAAIHGFVSVAFGAFAAHALSGKLEPRMLANVETAARYEMYHALALIAVAWLASRNPTGAIQACGWCFALGTLVFSGSLYVLALTGITKLGAITPIGGSAMLAGWLLLGWSAWTAGTAK